MRKHSSNVATCIRQSGVCLCTYEERKPEANLLKFQLRNSVPRIRTFLSIITLQWRHYVKFWTIFSCNAKVSLLLSILTSANVHNKNCSALMYVISCGARGSVVGWGIITQAGRARVRFPIRLLNFLVDLMLPDVLWSWGRLSLQHKWFITSLPGCKGRPASKTDNFTAICEPSV
jgi:hypothetical protein